MATYVLIGGAWIGGWAWTHVARELRAQGHAVYLVTLTGLGERVHLASPEVDLETHITDVINVINYEDLSDVVLVGHSYAGNVVGGVADRIAERLSQVVYLDSGPLGDGRAHIDFYPPAAREQIQQQVDASGEGWKLPVPGFEQLAQTASLAGHGRAGRVWSSADQNGGPPRRRVRGDGRAEVFARLVARALRSYRDRPPSNRTRSV